MDNEQDKKILEELAKAEAQAKQLNLQVARIDDKTPQKEALALLPKKIATEYRLIPLFIKANELSIGFADTSLFGKPMPDFLVLLKDKFDIKKYIIIGSDLDEALKAYDNFATELSIAEPNVNNPKIPESVELPDASNANATPVTKEFEEISIASMEIPLDTLEKFPQEVAKKYLMVVFRVEQNGKLVHVASFNPNDPRIKDIVNFVEKRNKVKVKLYKAKKEDIELVISGYNTGGYKPEVVDKEPEALIESTEQKVEIKEIDGYQADPSSQLAQVDKIKQIATESVENDVNEATEQDVEVSKVADEVSTKSPIKIPSPQTQNLPEDKDVINAFSETDLDQQLNGAITKEDQLEVVLRTGVATKVVGAVISFAVSREVSDIHIEPMENDVLIRYRIDGILQEIAKLPKNLLAPMVSRIKILSNLKIDEVRLPQDGRFSVRVAGHDVDLRVSTLPTVFGEKAVLRILDKTTGVKELEDLDFLGTNLDRLKKSLSEPYGIILVTGPTGSGKSTTLYAMLKRLNTTAVNIITLEDPVEYQLDGMNQTQIKDKIGYGFAEGLRSIVRQDPDIIMVGEIRDKETATLATQAALTGHLVLSTLHTNNAAGAIPRLIDMEVEPFLLSSSINMIIAQRLVRKLCQECKQQVKVSTETLEKIKQILEASKAPEAANALAGELKFYDPKGCDKCSGGYKGRLGIFEVLPLSEDIATLTIKKADTSTIDEQAKNEGMISMRVDGVLKALKGLTSLGEVLQVTAD